MDSSIIGFGWPPFITRVLPFEVRLSDLRLIHGENIVADFLLGVNIAVQAVLKRYKRPQACDPT